MWALVTKGQMCVMQRVALGCIQHIRQGDSDNDLNWDLPITLSCFLRFRKTSISAFSLLFLVTAFTSTAPLLCPWSGVISPLDSFQFQWKSVPVTRLNASAEALPAWSKAKGLLRVSYRWPSCLHISACWDFFLPPHDVFGWHSACDNSRSCKAVK